MSDRYAMHGSVGACRKIQGDADPHGLEATSGRSALHKAAFWGHTEMVKYLTEELKLNVNLQDADGDSPLHEAAKFGHVEVAQQLLAAGANKALTNAAGDTPYGFIFFVCLFVVCLFVGWFVC
jgi:ankyrin repeat protein